MATQSLLSLVASTMISPFRFSRQYTGPVKAVIMDWSGTLVDKYVIAPATVFQKVFERQKVPITMLEAREPMGMRKDQHIQTILEMPSVRDRWKAVHGRYPDGSDVQTMYKEFIPLQLEILKEYSTLIPGAMDTGKKLKAMGLKIGVTTGFTREMVDMFLPDIKKAGFPVDANVTGDEVLNGQRPKPFMMYKNLDLLDVPNIASVVKVDDCTVGIGEAQSAGCWGVGVARHSNYMNINSLEEEKELSQDEIQRRLERSRKLLTEAGAHYVIDTITELPAVVEHVNTRLANGETP